MDTIRKKYRAIRSFSYTTDIDVRGKNMVITFDGGSRPSKVKGFFVTDDKEVQNAMEALPQFNVDFYLEETFRYEKVGRTQVPPTREVVVQQEPEPKEDTPEATDTPDAENPVGPEAQPEATEQAKEGDNSFPDVTNAQSAKIIMLGLFPEENTEIAELRKADEIRQFANKKGIVFPNWL